MGTRSEDFSGLSVAMITPFKNGSVDYNTLQDQVEFQIKAGTTSVVPVGTTGESPTLSHEEHHKVIEATIEAAAGKIKVMAGTGSNSTQEALELTQFAEKAGADAALLVGPYYNKPMQEGFYQHFRAIAQAVNIPLCIYNIPGRTGKIIDAETIIRLAEFKNITMVKEATGQMDMATRIIGETDLTILSGDDSLTLPFMSIGARGVVSVIGNFIPEDVIALCKAIDRSDLPASRLLHQKTFALSKNMLSLATNPIPVKAAMKMLGRDTGELRLPMTPLDNVSEKKLCAALVAYGLIKE